MAKKKSLGKFFVYCILILALFLVMIQVMFSFSGKIVKLEIIGLCFLMLLTLIGFVGYNCRWGERVLFFVFLFNLGNLIWIRYFTNDLFMLPLFLTLFGFLMAFPKKRQFGESGCGEDLLMQCDDVLEEPPVKENTEAKIKAEFSPGKYVASKMGSVYHVPKCEWAKKIVEERRIWFGDKEEAEDKKYKAHKCVE